MMPMLQLVILLELGRKSGHAHGIWSRLAERGYRADRAAVWRAIQAAIKRGWVKRTEERERANGGNKARVHMSITPRGRRAAKATWETIEGIARG